MKNIKNKPKFADLNLKSKLKSFYRSKLFHTIRSIKLFLFILIFGLLGVILLLISNAATPIITPISLTTSPGQIGQPFTANLVLSNGSPALWTVKNGELPDGLSLINNQITGTPQQAGASSFTIQATVNTTVYTKGFTILIYPQASTGYGMRVSALINKHYTNPWPKISGCTQQIGYLSYGTAALWLNQNTSVANDRLSQVQLANILTASCTSTESAARSNLWLNYLVRPYMLFNSSSAYFPGRLTTAAEDNLIAQAWAYAKPYSKLANTNDVWSIYDSENHNSQSKSFFFIAAQMFKNDPDYQNRVYADGSTPQQQYQAWHNYWSNFLDERAKKGFFIEAGSPTYHGYSLQGILNIYNFAEDPVLRKKAGMLLDLDFADYAQNQLKNIWGGAKSRSYPDDSYDGASDSMKPLGDLIFGQTSPSENNHTIFLATSGYYPPEVIRNIATDPAGRGSYEYTIRRPGVGPPDWDNAMNYHVSTTKSVLHYNYVTPDYILGSAQLKPGESYTKVSGQNRWQGIIFNTSPQDRIYPLAAPPTLDRTFDSWFSVQKKHTLLMRKNGDLDKSSLVYFPSSLDTLDEENGWLFVKEGNAYLSVRPASGSYSWLTASKNQATDKTQRYIKLSDAAAPIIFDAARTNEYASFTAFKMAITNNVRSFSNGLLTYTNTDGDTLTLATTGSIIPTINSQAVNYAPTKGFNSPFMVSNWNTGIYSINKNGLSASYNFSDTNNPVKSVVSDTTPPSVPQNLTATNVSSAKVSLQWQASTDAGSGIKLYKIYRKIGSNSFAVIATSTSLTYQDASVISGTTYAYVVTAVDGSGLESAKSTPIVVDVPASVTFDIADLDNNGKVELLDFAIFKSKFGQTSNLGKADLDGNGVVNLIDFGIFVQRYRLLN